MNDKTRKKSFWALMVTQFFGAFNDNVFQIVVALLVIKWMDEASAKKMVAMSGVVFAAPFLLFSLGAGRLADRWSKARIIVLTKTFDLFVVALVLTGIYIENIPLILVSLFLLALQSTFFAPAKYGILPELKTEAELSQANGLLSVASFIAILTGTIAGTFLINNINAIAIMTGVMAIGSLVGSLFIEKVPAANPQQELKWNPLPDFFKNWTLVKGNRPLRLSLIAVSYFWFVGGVLHLNTLVYVKQVMHLSDKVSGFLLTAIVIGIALGSLLAGKLSKDKVELGLVPIGAIGTSLFTLDLYFSHGSLYRTLFDAFMLGMSSGIYVIPLNTLIQLRSPKTERGRILSTANFMSFIAILLASGFLWVMNTLFNANPAQVFMVLGFLSLGATVTIYLYLPQAFMRLLLYFLTNTFYRLNVRGRENVPIQGPALLVPNHVSMADPFLIAGALSRLVRFIMFRAMYDRPFIRPFVKSMDVIPISENDNPKEIMRSLLAARKKLEEGHLVCIFAEGEISRLGGFVMGFKRGLEIIMKGMDNVPIIPVHLEGVWGSIFSFEGKKWLWKWPRQIPYPVTVTFGKPMFKAAPHQIRQEVMDLGSEAFRAHRKKDPTLFETFLSQVKTSPSQKIVSDSSGMELSYLELLTASALLGKKLNLDKAVGILLPPCVAGVLANVALASQGSTPLNLNYTLSKEAVDQIAARAGVKKIITSAKMLEKLGWEKNENHILIESVLQGISKSEKILTGLLLRILPLFILKRTYFKKASHSLDDMATIMFTSGSTGIPKGVCLSQGNVLSNIQSLTMILKMTHDDVILGVLPFFHSFGFTGSLWFPLLAGFKATYHNNPLDSKTIGDLCQKEKVTFLIGTPTFLSAYIRRIDKEKFATLRFAVAGAEKLRPELAKSWEEKYGVPILEGYGCTELSPVVALNVPDIMDGELFQVGRKVGKIGRPIPGISVKIVDPQTGALLKPGEQGLLMVKGPNVMCGYLDEPEKTAEVIKDGWYSTGDIANIDEDGFIEITDRLSRFSKIGGEMVPHIMVEQKLHEMAKSVDRIFVVSSIPDEKKGEALVVVTAGFTGDIDQLWKDLNASDIPKLWIPAKDKFISIEAIPVLGSGKVDMPEVKKIISEKIKNA